MEDMWEGWWWWPEEWLRFVEEDLPRGVHVHLVFDETDDSHIWHAGYRIAQRCRVACMSWEEVGLCMKDIETAADWARRTGVNEENEIVRSLIR